MARIKEEQLDDFRSLRSDTHNQSGVLGSYNPLFCYSWHNNAVAPDLAYSTLIHEGIHADCMSGTNYELSLLIEYVNKQISPTAPSLSFVLRDNIAFCESAPKAYDILTGFTTSYYRSHEILNRATRVSSLVRDVLEKSRLAECEIMGLDFFVMIGLYRAVADCYTLDSNLSFTDALDIIEQFVLSHESDKLRPASLHLDHGIKEQYRVFFRSLLPTDRFPVNVVDAGFGIFNVYAILMLIVLGYDEQQAARLISRVFFLLMDVTVGPAHIHFAVEPKPPRVHVGTTTYFGYHMLQKDAAAFEMINDDFRSRQSKLYGSEYDYVAMGYLVKNIDDYHLIGADWVSSYCNQMIGAFPSALINIFDLLIGRQGDTIGETTYNHLREYIDRHVAFEIPWDSYLKNQTAIWKVLNAAVPHVMLNLIYQLLEDLDDISKNLDSSMEFQKDRVIKEGLLVAFGGRPFMRLGP